MGQTTVVGLEGCQYEEEEETGENYDYRDKGRKKSFLYEETNR